MTRPDGRQLAEVAALMDAGVIKPFVSRVFPLDQLGRAYAEVATGRSRGKVVIDTTA